jgi:sodium-dependent dicarboxylate transporter 2/3/5
MTLDKNVKNLLISLILAFVGYFLALGIFNDTQSRLIGMVVLLVSLWTNQAIPMGVVSILPIVMFPLLGILDTNSTTANYSKSIIFLFLGGFLLSIAVEKIGLHKIMANKLLSYFPRSPRGIIFALSITSALLSSVLSNTTTALLLMPIAIFFTDITKLKIRLVLAVAYGASIGGIITPIGTPPNLILMGFLESHSIESLSFIVWMLKTFPLAMIMLVIVSYILSIGVNNLIIDTSMVQTNYLSIDQRRLTYILVALVVVLASNSILGLNEAGILLGFGILMFIPKIGFLEWEDTKKIPYEIIFLFGAGFSIAKAFGSTNLAQEISSMLLGLTSLEPFLLILLVAALVTFTTEVTSNTALISMALPIIYSLGQSANLDTNQILMVATICASYAFMLPISTPPNAIAFSYKVLKITDMVKFGFFFNILAVLLTSTIAIILW